MSSHSAAEPGPATRRSVAELRTYLQQVCRASIDEALLARALTHRSHAYESGGRPHNERLEFLGDSVLGLVITDSLFTTHPDLPEGQLAKLRAAVVNMRALADVARTLGLGDFLLLGRGEETTGGRDKASILADTMEAVIGAVYLSGGVPAAAILIHHLLDPLMAASANLGAGLDWKTSLQEAVALRGLGSPEYHVDEDGPEHAKTFHAAALVGRTALGRGSGRTKKEAEQRAAEQAWTRLQTDGAAVANGAGEPAPGGGGELAPGGAGELAPGGAGELPPVASAGVTHATRRASRSDA